MLGRTAPLYPLLRLRRAIPVRGPSRPDARLPERLPGAGSACLYLAEKVRSVFKVVDKAAACATIAKEPGNMTREQILQNVKGGTYGERYSASRDETSKRILRLFIQDVEAYCEARLGAKLPDDLFYELMLYMQVFAHSDKWGRLLRVLDDALEKIAPFFDNYPSELSQDPVPLTYEQIAENIRAKHYEAWMPGWTPGGGWDLSAPTGTVDWKERFISDLRGYCDTQLGMRLTDYQFDRVYGYMITECERVHKEPFRDDYTGWMLGEMRRYLSWVRPFALSEAAALARSRPYTVDHEIAALF